MGTSSVPVGKMATRGLRETLISLCPAGRDSAQVGRAQHMTGWQDQLGRDDVLPQRADVRPRGNTGADANGRRVANGVDQVSVFVEGFGVFDLDNGIKAGRQWIACIEVAGLVGDLKRDRFGLQGASRLSRTDSEAVHRRSVIMR